MTESTGQTDPQPALPSRVASLIQRCRTAARRAVTLVFSEMLFPGRVKLGVAVAAVGGLSYVLLSEDPFWLFKLLPIEGSREEAERIPDKVYHFCGYMTLSLIFMWYAAVKSWRVIIALILLAVGHAAATEFFQQFVPDRTSDVMDLVANLGGITLGTCLGLLGRLSVRRDDPEPVIWLTRSGIPGGTESMDLRPPSRQQLRPGLSDSAPLQRQSPGQAGADSAVPGMDRQSFTADQMGEIRERMINFRFLGILCGAGAVFFGSVLAIHAWQVQRNASSLLVLGQRAREQGDLDRACDYYSRYIGLVPRDIHALAEYGQLLDQSAQGPDALRRVFSVYEDILRSDPTREDIRRRQVQVAVETGRFPDALSHVTILRQRYPADGELDLAAGRCFEALADDRNAVEAYQAAIQHAPRLVDAWKRLAGLYHSRLDQPERAVTLMGQLVEQNSLDPQAWLARARFLQRINRLDDADADMRRALRMEPARSDFLLASAELGYARAVEARTAGRNAQADRILHETSQALRSGLERDPGNVDLRLQQVLVLSHSGHPEQALAELEQLLQDAPGNARALLLLADLTIAQGSFDRARQAIGQLPRTPASDAMRLYLEGCIAMSEDRWTDAIPQFEQARRFLADSPEMQERADLALAQCHGATGDTRQQLSTFRQILKNNPRSTPARLGLAAVLLQSGQLQEAIAEYRPLQMLPQVRLLLARLLIVHNLKLPEVAREWREVELLLEQSHKLRDDPTREVLVRAELLAAQGQMHAARRLIETARASQTDCVEFLIALARLAEHSGDQAQAAMWFGQAQVALGQSAEAEASLLKALEQNPTQDAAAHALMRFYMGRQQTDRALAVFRRHAPQMNRRDLARAYEMFGDLSRSVTLLEQELAAAPQNLETRVDLIDVYLRHGRADLAEPLLRKLIANEDLVPPSVIHASRRKLAVLIAGRGDDPSIRAALKLLDQNAAEKSASGIEDQRSRTLVLAASTQPADHIQAITLLEQLDDQRQLTGRDHWVLGRLYDLTDRPEQATAQMELALAGGADNGQFLAGTIRQLIRAGRLDRAAQWLDRQRQQEPLSLSTARLSAQLEAARGDVDAALRFLETFVTANTPDATPAAHADRLAEVATAASELAAGFPQYHAQFSAFTEGQYRRLVAVDPRRVDTLAQWLVVQHRHADAFALLDTAWQHLSPELAAGLSLATLTPAVAKEQADQVEQRLLAALRQKSDSSALRLCLGDLRSLQGRFDEAETQYRTILMNDREYLPAANNLAWLLAMRGRHLDEALALSERTIGIAGPVPQLLDTRGCARLALGNLRAAVADLKLSAQNQPGPLTLLHLAAAYAASGNGSAARDALERSQAEGLRRTELHKLDRELLERTERALSDQPSAAAATSAET